ncbi:hypothetical protein Tco_1506986 [Tanacetum coccineum]
MRDLPRDNPLVSVEVLRSNTYTGNPVKEILLKLNLPDHRSVLTDPEVQVKMEMEIHHSSRVNFITACSYSTDTSKDIMKAQDYALESATRILNMVPTKKVDKTPYELWYGKVPNLSYLKEMMGYYFYFLPENKIVVARYAEFLEKNLISQEVSGRVVKLEEIQDEDTSPSVNTSEIPMEVEGFEPPQEEVIPVRRSGRTHRAPNRLCLNVKVEEHSLRDLNEPTNYKATLLDLASNKWLDAINGEMQSMKDN